MPKVPRSSRIRSSAAGGMPAALDRAAEAQSHPAGILAASPSEARAQRGYTAIFGRDAAVCAIGMALSGDAAAGARGASPACDTLAAHQAPNGQIPKFVDPQRREADFWYLGCIDATLWWLIAIDFLDARRAHRGLRRRTRSRSGSRSSGCSRRSISASSCCSRTRRATGRTSCRARASCCTPMRSGIT